MAKHKAIIFEIADNRFWRNFYALGGGVYWVNYGNTYTTSPNDPPTAIDSDFNFESIGLNLNRPIISISVGKEIYQGVETLAECYGKDTEKVFYVDTAEKNLFIHFVDHRHPKSFSETTIELGFSEGYMKSSVGWSGITELQQYREKLLDSSLFEDSKDDPYRSLQTFNSTSATLKNEGFELSPFTLGFGSVDRTGTYARTRIYEGDKLDGLEESDFRLISQNTVKEITEGAQIDISLNDLRTLLDSKSPTRILDNSLYPDLSQSREVVIPEAWGKVYGVNVLCLNEQVNEPSGTTDYKFMLCDATKPQTSSKRNLAAEPITAIYVDGKDVTSEVETEISPNTLGDQVSQENGIHVLTLPLSIFYTRSGSGAQVSYRGMSKVTVDFDGYSDGVSAGSGTTVENSMEILTEIIYDNYAWPYTDTYYNTEVWDANQATAPKCGYYFKKPETVQKKSEMVASDNFDTFIWDENLKFSWDSDDFTGYDFELTDDEFYPQDYVPSIQRNAENVLASFRIGYRPQQAISDDEDKYTWEDDTSYAETALSLYRSTKTEDFKTNLTDPSEIAELQGRIHTVSDIPEDLIEVSVPWRYLIQKAGDWGRVRINLPQRDFVGWTRCKIQSISPETDVWRTTLVLRIFEYFPYVVKDGQKVVYEGQEVIYTGG